MQHMLRIQMIGLAIVAALVMSAVAAGSASAAHEWLIGGAAIAAPVKVHSLGLLLLADTKAPGGEVKIHCHGFDTGTVGPGAYGLIEKITTTLLGTNERFHCKFDKAGACSEAKTPLLLALAVNLPWLTLLYLEGTEVRDLIEKDGGGGNSGWKIACTNILGGESVDECTSAPNHVGIHTTISLPDGVELLFDKKTPKATCSVGGAGAGAVEGFDLIESPGAGAANKLTFD